MTDHTKPVRVRLWEHATTRKAVMVHTNTRYHDASKRDRWLPLSRIEIVERVVVKHPDGDARPKGCPLITGTLLTVEAPEWLLKRKGLLDGAELDDRDRRYLASLEAAEGDRT